ncbi:MAG: DUF6090 family protein [Saprospiraceae bacterium]
MIKFFRTIRQSLLINGQTIKYLKYAFGEIVLVVIGILIALQINNWNLDRLDRKMEKSILSDLKVEFEANLADANRVMEGHEGMFKALFQIQENIKLKRFDNTEADSLIYSVFDWFTFTPKPGASNNLFNSGNLDLITNPELRNLLTLWPGLVADLKDDEDLTLNYTQNTILPFLADNYPISNVDHYVFKYYGRNDDLFPNIQNSVPVAFNAEKLFDNFNFQNHVSIKRLQIVGILYECRALVDAILSILSIIDQELTIK